jgi:hypothetical protein
MYTNIAMQVGIRHWATVGVNQYVGGYHNMLVPAVVTRQLGFLKGLRPRGVNSGGCRSNSATTGNSTQLQHPLENS